MRERFDLPGMRIIQFAFNGDPKDPFLPHNHEVNSVVYTGTHDNDTSKGWYERVSESEKSFYRRYLYRNGSDVAWDLIRATWGSVANFAIAPMQDFLNLDNKARMNYPGNPSGNWFWRMPDDAMSDSLQVRIKEINYLFDRENLIQNREEENKISGQENT
jgi:4-alpha-glucanotransferase